MADGIRQRRWHKTMRSAQDNEGEQKMTVKTETFREHAFQKELLEQGMEIPYSTDMNQRD